MRPLNVINYIRAGGAFGCAISATIGQNRMVTRVVTAPGVTSRVLAGTPRWPEYYAYISMRYEHTSQSQNGVSGHMQAISSRSATDRVKSPFRVAVISDEITQDFDRACHIVAHEFGMEWIELRSMWNKNMVNLDSKEIAEARSILEKYHHRSFT